MRPIDRFESHNHWKIKVDTSPYLLSLCSVANPEITLTGTGVHSRMETPLPAWAHAGYAGAGKDGRLRRTKLER